VVRVPPFAAVISTSAAAPWLSIAARGLSGGGTPRGSRRARCFVLKKSTEPRLAWLPPFGPRQVRSEGRPPRRCRRGSGRYRTVKRWKYAPVGFEAILTVTVNFTMAYPTTSALDAVIRKKSVRANVYCPNARSQLIRTLHNLCTIICRTPGNNRFSPELQARRTRESKHPHYALQKPPRFWPVSVFSDGAQALTGPQTVAERFDVLEEFLEQRLVGTHIDARVERAFKAIEDLAGLLRMAQLARKCRISSRHLHRLVTKWVGIAPKHLARIMRFQAALKRMETATSGDSRRIAADLGYFDQAHLTNESTQFAQTTPARIVAHHVADFSKTRCD
jgi:AraC-like DNA-binding protein